MTEVKNESPAVQELIVMPKEDFLAVSRRVLCMELTEQDEEKEFFVNSIEEAIYKRVDLTIHDLISLCDLSFNEAGWFMEWPVAGGFLIQEFSKLPLEERLTILEKLDGEVVVKAHRLIISSLFFLGLGLDEGSASFQVIKSMAENWDDAFYIPGIPGSLVKLIRLELGIS